MKKLTLIVLALSLAACNSVTVRRYSPAEQDQFLYHGAYGDYTLPRIKEPVYFTQATHGENGAAGPE
jgi:hypothetical protein